MAKIASGGGRLLELAEYISLAGAVVGTLAAIPTQQFIYGMTPLCLTLALNVTNRISLKKNQLVMEAEVEQLQQKIERFAADTDHWEQQFKDVMAMQNVRRNAAQTEVQLPELLGAIEQLRAREQHFIEAVEMMQRKINALNQQFQNRPELSQIESLTTVILALKKLVDEMPSKN
ncbi:hypothetical protein [[Phormidium] sp. ETS-05]|uniref:hypothetical protein n=1 Tax=[Phormidium] sp. ETS-05 TaxID=222819 RepID=UPI0018EF1248|nr:hypothetical protein [[Phormidium] sp. ETS-05]